MKSLLPFLILIFVASQTIAQNNRKPRIVGQDVLTMNEDQNFTVLMTHLQVADPDDWFYPWGFTMTIHKGDNYTFAGHVITPAPDFSGKLSVKVTVNDGVDDSNPFNLEIAVAPVNDKPVITGHHEVITDEDAAITILLSHLKVSDPDNKYPDDFSLRVHDGSNYSVSGNQVTPRTGFNGMLSVNVSVNDGGIDSDVYSLPVTVNAVNRVPQITGQAVLQVNEDQSVVVALSHLTVIDDDTPDGFALKVSPGQNYAVSNTTVTPASDFFGKLSVPVTVSDGTNTSKPFNLVITVTAVDDPPVLTGLETEPVFYTATDVSVALSANVSVLEVDGDSIMFASVGIVPEYYQANMDKLVYTPPPNSKIKGVFDVNTGVLTLLGQASAESYALAIRSVQYQALLPSSGVSKRIYFVVNDGKSDSERVQRELRFGQAAVSLDIPSGFTPNGDRANDTWKIIPLKSEEEYTQARIRVYNKTGVLVYESVGFEREWDGRMNGELLPADTYFYTIDLNINAPEGYLKGLVTILR